MAKQWAIAIGINTYRSFQSLHYAQQDAEAFCSHLIDSGITAPENCLLLTPSSAMHEGRSTFPQRENIAQWLKGLVTAGMGAEDSLWVFFSGYGIHSNGEDYLMAVDSDPAQPKETGIALKSIYRLLAQVPSKRVLVTLDMNRNAGSQPEPAGAYTAQLASQLNRQFPQLATILSCQPPDEFSRESSGLRHGFFTAGLLDVLHSRQRQQPTARLPLAKLSDELHQRMAELCANYWRPVQTPVVIGQYDIPIGEVASSAIPLEVSPGAEEEHNEVAVLAAPPLEATSNADHTSSNHHISGNSNGNGYSDPESSEIDPYAAAWEEEANQTTGVTPTGIIQVRPVAVGGRPGHGGDGTDWHWADLAVAAGTGDAPGLDPDAVIDEVHSGDANLSEANPTDAISSHLNQDDDLSQTNGTYGSGQNSTLLFPELLSDHSSTTVVEEPQTDDGQEKPVDGSLDHSGGSTVGVIVSPQPLQSSESENNGQVTVGLDDTDSYDSGPTIELTGESTEPDPNWNWSGTATAIDVEPQRSDRPDDGFHEGHGLVFEEGEPGDDVMDKRPIPGMPPSSNPSWDDDPEGLPIIDLDDEDLASDEFDENGSDYGNDKGSAKPAWLSLRLLGALGIVSLVALSLLGVFRGNQIRGNPAKDNGLWDGPDEDAVSTAIDNPTAIDHQTGHQPVGDQDPVTQQGSGPTNSGKAPQPSPMGSGFLSTPETGESPAGNQPSTGGPEFADGQAVNAAVLNAASARDDELKGAALLKQAATMVQPDQASSLNQAIALARKVSLDDPDYERSRQAMAKWSEQVLSLAQQRAERGQYLNAMAAARLVPSDLPGYEAAQRGINQWQLPAQLEHARAVIRPGQASSLNQAIKIARTIPGGTPQHPEAQQLMQQWSNSIFEIAQQRANQNQLGLAIAAAQLVPPDMGAFEAAQSAIADWQPQLNERP